MRIRTGVASAALAGLLTVAMTVPAQAAERDIPQDANSYSLGQEEARAAAGVGAFVTGGDYVHFSHTVQKTINAHGWWKKLSGPATKAKVTVWLQVKSGTGWRTLNVKSKNVYSGGGSAKRSQAEWKCTNLIQKHSFRSIVDVDLIGYPDDANRKITDTKSLYCGV
ncbi:MULTISPECIES: hypothetical protein [Streptomyces]|uniref:Secreted protein n=1 Tax=Streptomyces cremeus TaxID=66881 RepID=A0ABV5PDT3_STRCM